MSRFLESNTEMDRSEISYLLSPVQEAYWGRSKELIKAEKIFDKLIDGFHKEYTVKDTFDHFDADKWHKAVEKLLVSSEGKKLIAEAEKCFEKQFGFDSMHILVSREVGALFGPNAMTPVGCCLVRKVLSDGMFHFTPLGQSSGGYYDKSHSWVCTVLITAAIFDIRDLTGGELMGLILHEVGHNFQCTILTNIGTMVPVLTIYEQIKKSGAGAIALAANAIAANVIGSFTPEIFNKVLSFVNDIIADLSPETRKFIDMVEKYFNGYTQVLQQLLLFKKPFSKLSSLTQSVTELITSGPAKAAEIITGYSGEIFADSFATSYGYGPELSSALVKLEINVNYDYNFLLNEAYPLHVVYDLSITACEIIDNVINLDPHPSTQKRLLNQLSKLEREAKSSELPKDVQKIVLADIKRQRKMYKDYLETDDGKNKFAILATWRILNDKLGAHLDLKAIFNTILNLGKTEA